ncbi:hypothetical protein MMC13_000703 [Lambiella insularis]|nr:hypothetical protein [Lambiella insularis]
MSSSTWSPSSPCYEEYLPEEHYPSRNEFRNHQLQVLQDLEDLIISNVPPEVEQWEVSLKTGFAFSYPELSLRVQSISQHTGLPLQHSVENQELSRKMVDPLRVLLRHVANDHGNSVEPSLFASVMVVLRILEETTFYLRAHRLSPSGGERLDALRSRYRQPDENIDTAYHWLKKTSKEICDDILPDFRIIHVEPVIRSDLSRRFRAMQDSLRNTLSSGNLADLKKHIPAGLRRARNGKAFQIQDAVEYLTTPQLTFHGTSRQVVGSIVQYGFLKPGDVHPATGKPLGVRCGSTYGRGIYTSPSPSFSLMYSNRNAKLTTPSVIPGLKLLVCATLMGRVAHMYREDNWREMSLPYPGADSHVANDKMEYIVFNSAQVLPCYVLHIDWRDNDDPQGFLVRQINAARNNKPHPKLAPETLFPGDKERLKQERLAQASKFFAYGFGPVSGKNIVIQEIEEIDDDEEDYGEYQENRVEGESKQASIWNWGELEGYREFDEYAVARYSKRKN